MENIARVSLKTADKVTSATPSKKRRKTRKNDSSHDDVCQKQCATKYLSLKDNEDNDKTDGKPKKGVKFTLKTTNQRKVLKRIGTVDHVIANKKMRMLQCKNKEDKKTEESDGSLEGNEPAGAIEQKRISERAETESNTCAQLSLQNNSSNTRVIAQGVPNASNSTECSLSKLLIVLLNKFCHQRQQRDITLPLLRHR